MAEFCSARAGEVQLEVELVSRVGRGHLLREPPAPKTLSDRGGRGGDFIRRSMLCPNDAGAN
jgi:hypothetical protein